MPTRLPKHRSSTTRTAAAALALGLAGPAALVLGLPAAA